MSTAAGKRPIFCEEFRVDPNSGSGSYLADPIGHAPIRPDGLHFSALRCGLDSCRALRTPPQVRSDLIPVSVSAIAALPSKCQCPPAASVSLSCNASSALSI